MDLKDIFPDTIKSNTNYILSVSGTIDKTATWFGVYINNNRYEWEQVASVNSKDFG